MKVPIYTAQTCTTTTTASTGKPVSSNNTTLNTTFHSPTNNNNYEPTSVLDLQRSPSPAATNATTKTLSLDTPNNNNTTNNNNNNTHHHPTAAVDLDNLEGWDSILSELGLNDESNPNNSKLSLLSQITTPSCEPHLTDHQVLPDFPSSQPFDHTTHQPCLNLPSEYANFCDFSYSQNLNPHNIPPPFDHPHHHHHHHQTVNNGLDFIDDLIRAAQAFESNDSQQVHVILARLNQRLRSPFGKPLQRAAFFFKEALQRLTTTTNNNNVSTRLGWSTPPRPTKLSSYEVVQTIRAHKAFAGISPISLFSTFAGNQAILEAVADGSPFIHIIDFEMGFGGHWASFMRELVDKANDQSSLVLRITAIVPEEFGIETKLVKDNLTQFARELNLNFHIDFILITTFEILSFKSVKFIDGEKLAVHISPTLFHRFTNNSPTRISKFLADLRGISPSCVVVVDKEVGIDVGTVSFGQSFVSGIEFYTGILESLELAAAAGFTSSGDCLRRIEMFLLKPRIFAAVEAAARVAAGRRTTWREAFLTAGMRAVGFSQFADFQADCLLRRAQVGGFHMDKRHGELMLFWHDRPLVATSAWRC